MKMEHHRAVLEQLAATEQLFRSRNCCNGGESAVPQGARASVLFGGGGLQIPMAKPQPPRRFDVPQLIGLTDCNGEP